MSEAIVLRVREPKRESYAGIKTSVLGINLSYEILMSTKSNNHARIITGVITFKNCLLSIQLYIPAWNLAITVKLFDAMAESHVSLG